MLDDVALATLRLKALVSFETLPLTHLLRRDASSEPLLPVLWKLERTSFLVLPKSRFGRTR